MVSELQFLLARVLWAPFCDRDRAATLAELAARTHPDPEKRAVIQGWLDQRATPPIDQYAIAYLRRGLRRETVGL